MLHLTFKTLLTLLRRPCLWLCLLVLKSRGRKLAGCAAVHRCEKLSVIFFTLPSSAPCPSSLSSVCVSGALPLVPWRIMLEQCMQVGVGVSLVEGLSWGLFFSNLREFPPLLPLACWSSLGLLMGDFPTPRYPHHQAYSPFSVFDCPHSLCRPPHPSRGTSELFQLHILAQSPVFILLQLASSSGWLPNTSP